MTAPDGSADQPEIPSLHPVNMPEWLLRRERLLEVPAATRLIIVQSPLGSGKTVLAQQFALDLPGTHWYTAPATPSMPQLLETALAQMPAVPAPLQRLLIVDQAHQLPTEAHAHLNCWLQQQRGRWRLLLLSRTDLTSAYLEQFASGHGLLRTFEDLAFQEDEVTAFWAQTARPDERSLQAMKGWPLGHVLLKTLGSRTSDSLRTLLAKAVPQLWPFLPGLALVTSWDAALLQEALPTLPGSWIEQLTAQGFPMTLDAQGSAEPLPYVRDVLLSVLHENRCHDLETAERLRPLILDDEGRMRLLAYTVQCGLKPEALELAKALVVRYREALNFLQVSRVVELLPDAWRDESLTAALGLALLETGQAARGEVLLRSLHARGVQDTDILHALSTLAGRQGQHGRQLRLAEASLALHPPVETAWKLRQDCAYALLNLGKVDAAVRLAQALVEECEEGDVVTQLAESLCLMQVAYQMAGRLDEAERCLIRALQLYTALGRAERRLLLLNDLADLKRLQGDVGAGQVLISEAMALRRGAPSPIDPLLEETRGDLLMMARDYGAAQLSYEAALAHCAQHLLEAISQRLYLKLAEIQTLLGKQAAADTFLKLARKSYAGNTALLEFYEGTLLFHRGSRQVCRPHLQRALQAGCSLERRLRGHAMLAETEPDPVLRRTQLDSLRISGDQVALERLLANEWPLLSPELIQELTVSTLPVMAPVPDGGEALLTVLSFGTLQVACHGQPVRIPFAKAAELLLYLLAHGATSKERLVDALWDGSAEKRHADYFKVSLRQLRLSLKGATGYADPVPHEHGRYLLHPQLRVLADFQRLERAMTCDDVDQMAAALAGYAGDFLPMSYAEWVCEERARLVDVALTVALRLSRHPGAPWGQAVAACQRAIELDPLCDEPYQMLVHLYEQVNDLEMVNRYQRARRKRAL